MNPIDIAVLVILALFALAGLYRGFLTALFNLGAYLVSILLALLFMPLGANGIRSSESLYNMMLYYTEGSEYITNAEYVRADISSISSQELSDIISNAHLPYPMAKEISENIATEAFADQGVTTLGDYFNQTIVCVFINILVFLAIFALVRLILAFVINGVDYAWSFPLLRSGDSLLGMGLGVLRACSPCFCCLCSCPLA